MSKSMKNVLVLAVIETTQGVDAAPIAGANAVLARSIGPQPVVAEFDDRNLIRPYFGNGGKIQVSNYSEIEFEVEFAASGSLGIAPAYDALMRSCAFSVNVTASTNVIYAPITENPETATIYYYLDGLLHKMTSCRGTVSFELNARSIPVFKFKFTGVYSPPTDTPLPGGADYSNFQLPQAINNVNTPTMDLGGQSLCVDTFSIDIANQVKYRNLIGCEEVAMTDRSPTGQISLQMTSVADKAWHESVRAGSLEALQVVHGTVAGNIIQIDAPKAQLTNPQYSDSDNIAMLGMGLELQPDLGNDELIITLR